WGSLLPLDATAGGELRPARQVPHPLHLQHRGTLREPLRGNAAQLPADAARAGAVAEARAADHRDEQRDRRRGPQEVASGQRLGLLPAGAARRCSIHSSAVHFACSLPHNRSTTRRAPSMPAVTPAVVMILPLST